MFETCESFSFLKVFRQYYFECGPPWNRLLAVAILKVKTSEEEISHVNVSSLCVSKSITVDVLEVCTFTSVATAVLVGFTTNGNLDVRVSEGKVNLQW